MAETEPSSPPMLGYASGIHPVTEGDHLYTGGIFQDGELLIAFHGSTLPQRCILCGTHGGGKPILLTFTWDPSFQVTQVSTLQLRQKAHIHAFLCEQHRARWTFARRMGAVAIGFSGLLMCAGIVIAVVSESSDTPRWTPFGMGALIMGFACMICALFFFTLRSRTLACRRIAEGFLYLENASPRFLAHLPPASGMRGPPAT